jgi:hypothetical protein
LLINRLANRTVEDGFDDFCHANDPHEEHDFGAFDVDGHTIMFKIDYLDRDLSIPSHSEWVHNR